MTYSLPKSASRSSRFLIVAFLATVSAITLAGCGIESVAPLQTNQAALSGTLHGGQQPVAFATVQLIAPGITGYGSAGTVVASTTSDANGNFTLPRPFVCPVANDFVYLQATGGNAGAGTNPAIGLAALVGPCSTLQATDYFSINEVTTVAAAFALAPFATVSGGAASIGTSATNFKGLSNTAGPAGSLADVHTGTARGASDLTGVVLPTAEVNTLANILAACVNQGTPLNATGNCATLFSLTTPTGGAAPTDTFQAAINIALHPGVNTAALYLLPTAVAPFQPALTAATAPNDFVLPIKFNANSISQSYYGPAGIDIDANGNAWVAVGSIQYGVLEEISPASVYLTGANGITVTGSNEPFGLAISPGGNIEFASFGNNMVYSVTPTGTTNFVSSLNSYSLPAGVAIDNRDSSTWVANVAVQKINHLSATGVEVTGSPYVGGSYAYGVAVSGNGDVWVANSDQFSSNNPNSSLTHLTRAVDGTYTSANILTGTGTNPFDIAIDNSGNVWTSLAFGVGKYSSAGALLSPVNGYLTDAADSRTASPMGIEIDGLGRAIVSNGNSLQQAGIGSLTMFANDGTYLSKSAGGSGYTANGQIPNYTMTPKSLAIDGSGNVWISGIRADGHGPNFVVELVGVAAPVVTPLSTATFPNRLGTLP